MPSLPFFYDGRRRLVRGVFRWRTGTVYCMLITLLLFTCFGIVKNYIDSDYQLFHWHVPVTTATPEHKLCVLVPFRDRATELQEFAPHIHRFLKNQLVQHKIIVLNQTDEYRFNRASLINVGWFEADRVGCDYLVMHDVDLLPLNNDLNYSFPGFGVVRHISSPQYHPNYNYTKFVGGILMLTVHDYKLVNGMSNKYWGWGLEDDEFFLRLRDANLTNRLERSSNLTTDRHNTFRHIHDKRVRRRDRIEIGNQRKMARRRDRVSGLDSVKYNIASRRLIGMGEDDALVSVLDVQLYCDLKWTSYCKLPKSTGLGLV